MKGFKFTTTDGVIVGIGALLLTFFYYMEQSKKGNAGPRPTKGAAHPNAGATQG